MKDMDMMVFGALVLDAKFTKKIEVRKSKSVSKVTSQDKKHLTEYVINWLNNIKE